MNTKKSLTFVAAIVAAVFSTSVFAQGTGTLFVQDGQVLIGDDTPVADATFVVKSSSTGPTDAIYLENATGPARLNLRNLAQTNTATKDQVWTINSNGDLRFTAGTDGAEMRLFADGVLRVAGGFQVAGGPILVPDYVFEPDYELMPLDDLRNYIDKNGHLPEVPSAEDVKEDGLDMTAMQMRLLRKVEELTLYTLKQQETIESLQNKMELKQ